MDMQTEKSVIYIYAYHAVNFLTWHDLRL